jgi:MFS family permease
VIQVVVYLASVAAPLHQFKVPPLLPVLMAEFQLNLTQAGALMSVFAITGLLLALPAGIILQRAGPKVTGGLALGCLAGGATLGALTTQVGLLLTSRVIEGIGMGLLGVVAPATIAMWFPPERQGTPMGIWATWVPVGNLLMYLLAPAVATAQGWPAVWWLAVGYTLVILAGYLLLMRRPPRLAAPTASTPPAPTSLWAALANRDLWLLSFAFACFNIVFLGTGTFLPTFLAEIRSFSLGVAATVASVASMGVLVSAPVSGWLSDRLGSRRWMIILPFLLVTLIFPLPFILPSLGLIVLAMALQGLVIGAIPTATFAAAPEVMGRPELAGLGVGALMVGQNLGTLIGPLFMGEMVRLLGWTGGTLMLIPFCLLGAGAVWLTRVR